MPRTAGQGLLLKAAASGVTVQTASKPEAQTAPSSHPLSASLPSARLLRLRSHRQGVHCPGEPAERDPGRSAQGQKGQEGGRGRAQGLGGARRLWSEHAPWLALLLCKCWALLAALIAWRACTPVGRGVDAWQGQDCSSSLQLDCAEPALPPAARQVVAKFKGEELKGRTYEPLFPYFAHLKSQARNGRQGLGRGAQGAGRLAARRCSLPSALPSSPSPLLSNPRGPPPLPSSPLPPFTQPRRARSRWSPTPM